MNDLEIMLLVASGLKALPGVPNDPDDSITVSLTRRELVLLASVNPLVALTWPDIAPYVLSLDGKIKELVEAQKPEWLIGSEAGE